MYLPFNLTANINISEDSNVSAAQDNITKAFNDPIAQTLFAEYGISLDSLSVSLANEKKTYRIENDKTEPHFSQTNRVSWDKNNGLSLSLTRGYRTVDINMWSGLDGQNNPLIMTTLDDNNNLPMAKVGESECIAPVFSVDNKDNRFKARFVDCSIVISHGEQGVHIAIIQFEGTEKETYLSQDLLSWDAIFA
jgi:hypothetical protein